MKPRSQNTEKKRWRPLRIKQSIKIASSASSNHSQPNANEPQTWNRKVPGCCGSLLTIPMSLALVTQPLSHKQVQSNAVRSQLRGDIQSENQPTCELKNPAAEGTNTTEFHQGLLDSQILSYTLKKLPVSTCLVLIYFDCTTDHANKPRRC